MPSTAHIELRDLKIAARIGTYGSNDVVPNAHLLDLRLTISAQQVLIPVDDMALVFDYDPLIVRIDAVSRSAHFQTQERLITLIVEICADFQQIEAVEICLRKTPVLANTGFLGVRLFVPASDLNAMRGGSQRRYAHPTT